jgi:hypothetical protein
VQQGGPFGVDVRRADCRSRRQNKMMRETPCPEMTFTWPRSGHLLGPEAGSLKEFRNILIQKLYLINISHEFNFVQEFGRSTVHEGVIMILISTRFNKLLLNSY